MVVLAMGINARQQFETERPGVDLAGVKLGRSGGAADQKQAGCYQPKQRMRFHVHVF